MIDVYLMISSLTFIFHTLLFLFSHLFTTYSFDPQIEAGQLQIQLVPLRFKVSRAE